MKKNIEKILLNLNIGNNEFWKFMDGKVKSYPLGVHDFGWGCFAITNENDLLVDIRVLVPTIIDESTLLVNIHELTHAFELYGKLGKLYEENVEKSEEFAKNKEKEYLTKVKKISEGNYGNK